MPSALRGVAIRVMQCVMFLSSGFVWLAATLRVTSSACHTQRVRSWLLHPIKPVDQLMCRVPALASPAC